MNQEQTVWVVSNMNEENLLPLLVDRVTSYAELPEIPPFAVILSKSQEQDWMELLHSIRTKKAYRYTPIFYHGDVPPKLEYLFDGPADGKVIDVASVIHERISSFGFEHLESDDKELLFLAYLYSRPNLVLKGFVSHDSAFIFEYPLLNVMFVNPPGFDEWRFLQDLVMRDLLVQDALIDEIHTCGTCESGLLNLKNTCPNCHSIDIKPQKFVHCYSCGKIGPVPEFLREERLICSRCKTKLQELGVDYEKPKEDKLCNSCGHFFAISELELVCLVCHRSSQPNALSSRRLYDYSLTRRGEYLVRGIEKSIYREFNHFFKVIDHNVFMLIASWQSKLSKRYGAITFAVMTLQITNETELVEKQGEMNSERLMGQFFTGLCQAFRDSDLSARLDGTMYFLLPMANQDGCLVIIDRIRQTVQELAEEGIGKDLTVGVSYLTSWEITEADLVFAELQTRMLESNNCLIGAK